MKTFLNQTSTISHYSCAVLLLKARINSDEHQKSAEIRGNDTNVLSPTNKDYKISDPIQMEKLLKILKPARNCYKILPSIKYNNSEHVLVYNIFL